MKRIRLDCLRGLAVRSCLLAGAGYAPGLAAHPVDATEPTVLLHAWNDQLWLWLLIVAALALYVSGIVRLWRHADTGAGIRRWELIAFLGGWSGLCLALLSPLDAMGNALFWVHMVQHEVLMLIAAPLLVLGRPLAPMLWGLPRNWRPAAAALAVGTGLKRLFRVLTRPMTAWWIHAALLWVWHAPALFEAALSRQWVHELQHTSFFVSALLFWWALFQGPGARPRYGMAVLYVLTTAVHASILGALITFSDRVLYPGYIATAPAFGLTALQDQQLGGLIMWVPGGVVYLGVGLSLFAAWLRMLDRRERLLGA